MIVELVSDEQMVDRIIDLSCDYDIRVGAPCFRDQKKFFNSLKTNPRMREAARDYLHCRIQDMPKVLGMHVW